MRYTGPRNRIARREATDLGYKTVGSKSHERLLKKLNVSPGQQTGRRRRKISDRSRQLREKQKLRFLYLVSEKQLKGYFQKATKKKGNTALYLAKFLENRLDNIVYKSGFTPTRFAARQLVAHRHIKVNQQILSIPSYQAKIGDIITLAKQKSVKIPYVEKSLTNKDLIIPNWLERKAATVKVKVEPDSEDVEKLVNLRLVIEHYSR